MTIKYGILTGLSIGIMFAVLFFNEALGFYAGTKFIIKQIGDYNVAKVLTTFFGVMIGTITLG